MSVCSDISLDNRSERSLRSAGGNNTTLPVLPYTTCSASRKSLLKKEFQQNFGRNGNGAKYYCKALRTKRKKPVAVVHANRVLQYAALDSWLRKHNLSNVSTDQLSLSNEEFIIFFKWFDMKMKRYR